MKQLKIIILLIVIALFSTACAVTLIEPEATAPTELANLIEFDEDHYGVHTEIIIDAPAAEVWAVLTDWDEPLAWSTGFLGVFGDIADGAPATVLYASPEGGTLELPRASLIYVEGVEFGWSEESPPPFNGFIDRHIYRVEPLSTTQTRFVQSDNYRVIGPNEVFTSQSLAEALLPTYQQFNQELKAAVEGQ